MLLIELLDEDLIRNTIIMVLINFVIIICMNMGWACGTYWGEESCIQGFGGGNLKERDHFGDPGVDGRIILRWIFRKWDEGLWTGSRWLR